jgi:hypothetical protein
VLGILGCIYLVYYLPPTSWLRFTAWLNFGFVIYFGYGTVNSRLTGRHLSDTPAEHDAKTSYIGGWLALIGTGILFFMHGLTQWLQALTEHQNLPWLQQAGAALGDVMHLDAWLTREWFLIVPVALNALVLCPIIIRRGLRAKREGGADRNGHHVNVSIGVASTLIAAIAAYLLLVFAR